MQHDDTEPHVSYMRGDIYVWASDVRTHFWVKPSEASVTSWANDCGYASGVALGHKLVDEFVAMRWAELSRRQRTAARKRAVARWGGNFGCVALRKQMGKAEERRP